MPSFLIKFLIHTLSQAREYVCDLATLNAEEKNDLPVPVTSNAKCLYECMLKRMIW